MKEISITSIEGIQIGNAEYAEHATGCTAILCKEGVVCGVDVRGGAPASRENALLNPLAANDSVHAIMLCGGSAYGLDAATGAMQYLEERNIGFPTGAGVVPIVCASSLFDLQLVNNKVRPDKKLGYQACINAENNLYKDGSYGAGTGATVGKILGMKHAMKAGIGSYAVQLGDLIVGAIVAVNAVGDIYDEANQKIAGMIDPDSEKFIDAEESLIQALSPNLFLQNTTIGVIITNGICNKTEMTKIAGFAHDGYARAIRPVHTMFDGDSIYAVCTGKVKADINVIGTLAAKVMAKAITHAAIPEGPSYGLPVSQHIINSKK